MNPPFRFFRLFILSLLFPVLLLSTRLFARSFVLSIGSGEAVAGERVPLSIRVLKDDSSPDTEWSGYVRLSSAPATLRFKGRSGFAATATADADLDKTGSAEIFLRAGTNLSLNLFSFHPGEFTITVTDPYGLIPSRSAPLSLRKPKGKILFSEVMFKTSSASLRYVELYNASPETVTLTNLSLARYSSASSAVLSTAFFTSASPALLAPGQYALIPADYSLLAGFFPAITNPDIILPGSFSSPMSEYGSHLILTRAGVIEDACEYESSWTTENVSLERLSFSSPAAGSSAWAAALSPSPVTPSVKGTPGRPNTMTPSEEKNITLSLLPEKVLLSPDDTELRVLCEADRPGRMTLSVLDSAGRPLAWPLRYHMTAARTPVEALFRPGPGLKPGLYLLRLEFTDESAGLRTLRHASFVIGW